MTNASKQALRRERILAATLTVLLGAVLLTSHAVSGAMAKYTTAASSSDEARVALFGHSESINFSATWPGETGFVPGAQSSAILTVTNAENGKVSEVAQTYEIEIVTSGNLPLHYELVQKAGNGKTDDTPIGTFDESTSSPSHTFEITDGSATFEPGVSREDKYELRVSWPSAQNIITSSTDYSNRPDFVQVNINVKQVD